MSGRVCVKSLVKSGKDQMVLIIVGVVCGVVIIALVVAIIVVCCRKKQQQKNASDAMNNSGSTISNIDESTKVVKNAMSTELANHSRDGIDTPEMAHVDGSGKRKRKRIYKVHEDSAQDS